MSIFSKSAELQTRPFLIIFLILISYIQISGQDRVARYPVRMCQYNNSLVILNPSQSGEKADYEVSLGHQRLMGNFSKVATYYFNANIRITHKPDEKKPFSVIGFRFFNDREGKYLNRTRGYLNYSWHAKILKELKFSAGLEIGGMNYSVKGTPLSGDGSDLKPDASAGVSLYNNDFYVGLSMAQLFKSEVQPLEEVTVLYPYLNFTASKNINFFEEAILVPSTAIRFQTDDSKILLDFNLGVYVKKKLYLASGLHNSNKIVFTVGLTDFILINGKTNFHISYGFPASHSTLNYSFGEVGVGFFL